MHTWCLALSWCSYTVHAYGFTWYMYQYPSGLLHWHWGNQMIAPEPVKQPWKIWVISTCIQPQQKCAICAHFLRSTVFVPHHLPIYTKWPLQSYRHITVIVSAECTKYRGLLAMKGCRLHTPDTHTHSGLAQGTKYWQKNFPKFFVLLYGIISSDVYFRVPQQGFIHITWIINDYRQDYVTFQMIWYIPK